MRVQVAKEEHKHRPDKGSPLGCSVVATGLHKGLELELFDENSLTDITRAGFVLERLGAFKRASGGGLSLFSVSQGARCRLILKSFI